MTKLYNINIQGERSKAMRKLMMGIDIGTQSIRVALVDTDGNIIAMRRHSHFIETPKPNWAVQDPASWWNILKKEDTGIACRKRSKQRRNCFYWY